MKLPTPLIGILLLILTTLASPTAIDTPLSPALTVQTKTGSFTGLVNENYPNIREFRAIPYAKAPIGSRRWLPPEPLPQSRKHRFATRFPPSCPQYIPRRLSVWNANMTDFLPRLRDQSYTSGLMAQSSAEDCLHLAVWTPLDASESTGPQTTGARSRLRNRRGKDENTLLPVAFFMTGGSFQTGGIEIPYQLPAQWVSRTQSHIVVTTNYRLNIIGFPNAAGAPQQNLGILDQRAALEWVRDNIASFGGDPARITMWGQSAGGVSADIHSYAFWDDPIVNGYFMQSGSTARKGFYAESPGRTNFTFVARNLGCDFPRDPDAEMDCMRSVPVTLLSNYLGQYTDARTASTPPLTFRPTPDDAIIFRNITTRALTGKVSRLPALLSNTANEQSSMQRYPLYNLSLGPDQAAVDEQNVEGFVCVTTNTTTNRALNNLTTYRYQYAGNFSNVTPLWWMGAYHSSDLPMLMGTFDLDGGASDFEREVSERMQDWLFEFMKDPEDGLRRRGWQPHPGSAEEEGMVMRFAVGDVVEKKISSLSIDNACWGKAKYNSSPGRRKAKHQDEEEGEEEDVPDDDDDDDSELYEY